MLRFKLAIILTSIEDIDITLFLFLNSIHSPTWDIVFEWITDKHSWIPFYILLLLMVTLKHQWKTIIIVFFIALLILASDQISVQLFKNVFGRLRPCHNPELTDLVHLINGKCGGKYGFVSSHATNSFSIAVFVGLLLKNHYRFLMGGMLFWATIVSYRRIYVGVHYPALVICGGILGACIAIVVFMLMKYINRRFNLKLTLN